jgi:hypothetical protein
MSSRQELNQAKERLLKAIAANKVKLSQSNEYLKIQQGDRTIRLPLISGQSVNSVNSFK